MSESVLCLFLALPLVCFFHQKASSGFSGPPVQGGKPGQGPSGGSQPWTFWAFQVAPYQPSGPSNLTPLHPHCLQWLTGLVHSVCPLPMLELELLGVEPFDELRPGSHNGIILKRKQMGDSSSGSM